MKDKKRTTRSVTMQDVAAHADVSRTVVSLVLNNRRSVHVAEETRGRVRAAASELGYRPNASARALAKQRSDWYGLVTEIVTAPFAAEVIKGAQDRAGLDGKYLLIASTDSDPDAETAAIEQLLEQRVEGLIYATTWHRPVAVPDLAREVPTVLVNCFDVEGRFPSVVPDERAGGRRATERLLEAGHRRIGLMNLDPDIPATVGRRLGHHDALREAGLPIFDELEVSGHATADGGFIAAEELLNLPTPPTAIFCANDRMAMGAYDAIKERGLRIPSDVAVVGFDNQVLIAPYLRPALTTIALPFALMGAQGVELLAAMAGGQSTATKTVTVDCPLIERASV